MHSVPQKSYDELQQELQTLQLYVLSTALAHTFMQCPWQGSGIITMCCDTVQCATEEL